VFLANLRPPLLLPSAAELAHAAALTKALSKALTSARGLQFESLKQIFDALLSSVRPVIAVFLILIMAISIYSLLGVHLFKSEQPEDFASFVKAAITMMGLATGRLYYESRGTKYRSTEQ